MRSNAWISGRTDLSSLAISASACRAKVLTIELGSSKYRRSAATARRRSFLPSGSRGTICAKCQRNSCCFALSNNRSNLALNGFSRRGCFAEAFSAASAARIRVIGSSLYIPRTSSANRLGFSNTREATSSDFPTDRISPPRSFSRRVREATGPLRSTSPESAPNPPPAPLPSAGMVRRRLLRPAGRSNAP